MPHAEWITVTAVGCLALIFAVTTAFVLVLRRFGQPAVIGEITAGICLGPSVLGLLPGGLPERIFPTEVRPHLGVVAQIGLLLFMFVIGWEFDGRALKGRFRSAGAIWISALTLSMALGVGLAALLYGTHGVAAGRGVPFAGFALFLGAAMSITAFPVLARIIAEHRLQYTRVGALALCLAAADDVLAWCLLAVVVALAAAGGAGGFVSVLAWSAGYLAVMIWGVRPLLAAAFRRLPDALRPYAAILAAAGAFGSAFATSYIGIHALFGAFVFGMVMPRDSGLVRLALPPLEHVGKLLLPVFFVLTGLSVDLTSLSGDSVLVLLAVIAAACLGKLGAVAVSARATGLAWRDATTLGVLMNTRGLTELVLLNVGLSLGLISVQLYSSLVVMALVTTAMAAPLLTRLLAAPPGEPPPSTPRRGSQSTVVASGGP
ncbi:cation:proton antiporter domain-containing protein [Streptomyces sp. O3]